MKWKVTKVMFQTTNQIYIYIPTGVLNSALSAMAQTSLLASETVMTTEQPKVVVIMAAEHSMDL